MIFSGSIASSSVNYSTWAEPTSSVYPVELLSFNYSPSLIELAWIPSDVEFGIWISISASFEAIIASYYAFSTSNAFLSIYSTSITKDVGIIDIDPYWS